MEPAKKQGPVLKEEEPRCYMERVSAHGCGGVVGVVGSCCRGIAEGVEEAGLVCAGAGTAT